MRRPSSTPRTSARENQRPEEISASSTCTGWGGSAAAWKPSISEPGNGQGWLADVAHVGRRATPTSSATSRTTAASADSPGSTKPARQE